MTAVLSTSASAGFPAGAFRKRAAGDAVLEVDSTHDGPWMSVMSKDGRRVYRNKNVPAVAHVAGKQVQVDPLIEAHERAEWADQKRRFVAFRNEHGREPNEAERVALHTAAHVGVGVPAEKAKAKDMGVDWPAWNAWCRGVEAALERGPFSNVPADADVKPIPHKHGEETGELAAQDSFFTLALDRAMATTYYDADGRLRIGAAPISKACVNGYRGKEISGWKELKLNPERLYNLLRDPEELERAAPSFNMVPLLIKHTPTSAADHQAQADLVVGAVADCEFRNPYLDASLIIWTREAIDRVESAAQRELSAGYHYRVDLTPGNFGGVRYDGVMRDIVGNHVALVERGRAGSDVAIELDAPELQLSW
jgi:Uncharacterized protein conserved in bacteria (DUF2213)